MNLLFVGDVVGRPGRRALGQRLSGLVGRYAADFVIANGENAAGGFGISPPAAQELFEAGVDVITLGNHVWRRKEAVALVAQELRVLRPANYPPGVPGEGARLYSLPEGGQIGVINVMGRTFMEPLDCPFRAAVAAIEQLGRDTRLIVVDCHAEATSEKVAMARFLDGRVSAVLGTHTHVQTADETILPKGTAYITDVGMTGPTESILGVKPEPVITHFLTHMRVRFEVAGGPAVISAVCVLLDPATGRATSIQRIQETVTATV